MVHGSEIVTGGSVAGMVAHGLAIARERGWIKTLAQHRTIAAICSLATSMGLQLKFDSATGDFLLAGSITGLVIGLGHACAQYGVTDFAYKQWARIKLNTIFNPSDLPPTTQALADAVKIAVKQELAALAVPPSKG